MAIQCIDIAEDKKLSSVSPIAMGAFILGYIAITAFVKFGVFYVILVVLDYFITQIFFQYSARRTMLTLKFLITNKYLTPSFEDEDYVEDISKLKNLQKALLSEDEEAEGSKNDAHW